MGGKRIIAIVGATGAQGGALARAILDDPTGGFSVRALSRDVRSPAAAQLTSRGAHVVAADLDDPTSVARAFEGAYAAFCVTFFWHHFSPEKELLQAAGMADAARKAGIHHAIWSTLEDTRRFVPLDDTRMPTLMGKYKVPHFDAKGEANQLFEEAGVPITFLLTSFYWDNLINFGIGPFRGTNGKLLLTLPMDDKKLPGIAADDIGKCAYGIFDRPGEFIGETVGIAGEHLTGQQMARALTNALGEEVAYDAVSPEVYRRLRLKGAEELANMFQFKRDFQNVYCRTRSVERSRLLNPSLESFDQWLARNKSLLAGI